MKRCLLGLLCIASFSISINLQADQKASQQDQHLGVNSCGGSMCHGRQHSTGDVVFQNEIAIWQSSHSYLGAHHRAYQVLNGALGKAITRNMGWEDASKRSECLGCHTDLVPEGGQGLYYQITDGVSCESCHGGSERWLKLHYDASWDASRHADMGYVDLSNVNLRAQVCLDCHLGSNNGNQFVTHEMMSAGHPRLAFELSIFEDLQAHYEIDQSEQGQDIDVMTAQVWALGQITAAERYLDLVLHREVGAALVPELSLFDCRACHQDFADAGAVFDSVQGRDEGRKIGQIVLSDYNIRFASLIELSLGLDNRPQIADLLIQMNKAIALSRASFREAAGKLRTGLMQLKSHVSESSMEAEAIRQMRAKIFTSDSLVQDYAGAEQVYFALLALGVDSEAVNRFLSDQIAEPSKFSHQAFREALIELEAEQGSQSISAL